MHVDDKKNLVRTYERQTTICLLNVFSLKIHHMSLSRFFNEIDTAIEFPYIFLNFFNASTSRFAQII